MVPASVYLGFSASIIWVGQGTYLTSTANSNANEHNLHEGTVIGKFNGVFWGIFACHQVVGNLMTVALLRDEEGGTTSGTTLLLIVFLISMTVGTVLICFLSKRNGKEERLQGSVDTFSYSVGVFVEVYVESITRRTNRLGYPSYCIFRITISLCLRSQKIQERLIIVL